MSQKEKSACTNSSSGSDSSSTGEEGRLRQLFTSCDTNNDGYLDTADLICMCTKLNMSDMAGEIVHALGADVKGAISFDEFLRARRHFMGCGRAGSSASGEPAAAPQPAASVPAPSGTALTQLGQLTTNTSNQRLDSSASDNSLVNSGAEYDSGAQDLSGEPQNLHKLLKHGYPEVYRRYYTGPDNSPTPAVSALLECANAAHLSKLQNLRTELRDANHRLRTAQNNRDAATKELSKLSRERGKLRADLRATGARYEDRLTELHSVIAELQKKLDRADGGRIREIVEEDEEIEEEDEEDEGDDDEEEDENEVDSSAPLPAIATRPASLQLKSSVLRQLQTQVQQLTEERDNLQQRLGQVVSQQQQQQLSGSYHGELSPPSAPHMGSKMCELRARRQQQQPSVLSDALIQRLFQHQQQQMAQQHHRFLLLLCESGVEPLSTCAREAALEAERVQARCDRLQSDAGLLQLCLEESKATAERLSAANLQHESNSASLHRAQMAADRALEAADILLQLAESEAQMLVAGQRGAELGEVGIQRAALARRQAEAAAKNLLHRLEGGGAATNTSSGGGPGGVPLAALYAGRTTPDSGQVLSYSSAASTTSSCSGEPQLQLLHHMGSQSSGGGGGGSGATSPAALQQLLLNSCSELSRAEERRLRGYLDEFRAERQAYRSQVVEVLDTTSDCSSPVGADQIPPLSIGSVEQLEQAVLMQELCGVKEERAELKARVYLLEREAAATELRLAAREASAEAARAQLNALRPSEGGGSAEGSSERVAELATALETLSRSSELQQGQSEEFIADLKRANAALIAAFEKARKKYQMRIKKLETQLAELQPQNQQNQLQQTNSETSL